GKRQKDSRGETINRVPRLAFDVAVAAIFLCFVFLGVSRLSAQAQKPAPTSSPAAAQQPAEEEEDPFAPEPPPVLPPGMTGADVNDPRAKLTPGLYDAGEAAMGMKHLVLLKKPGTFQLGASDPDDPKVQKMLAQVRMGNTAKMP